MGGAALAAALLAYPWVTLFVADMAYLLAIFVLWRREAVAKRRAN